MPEPETAPHAPDAAPHGTETTRDARNRGGTQSTRSGPGILLVCVYGVFALAATGRASVQVAKHFDRAPAAYLLSALAAVIYLVATVALARGDRTSALVARTAITIELVGVLVVGLISYLAPQHFPDKTVWSHFGQGYGFVPLVLPLIGLWWIHHTRGGVTGRAGRRG